MSDDNGFAAGFSIAGVFGFAAVTFAVITSGNYGVSSVRAEAIERGLGEYRVDQKTQRVEFHWTVKASGSSVQVEREHPAASILEQEAKP